MPLYEYKCSNNHVTEKIRKIDERNEPVKCSECSETSELQVSTGIFRDSFTMGRMQPSANFKERVKQIKEAHPLNTIQNY